MSNCAIIKPFDMNIGLYLHWNGGRDSVEGFLQYCKMREYRGMGEDSHYGLARLCQVISNYFGGGLSIGIISCMGTCEDAEGIDNGIYVVKGWEIADRIWGDGKASEGVLHPEHDTYKLQGVLEDIDETQPKSEQFGVNYLRAEVVPVASLHVGDIVYLFDSLYGKVDVCMVTGIGEDRYVNGRRVDGVPFVNKYGNENRGYADNINNYLTDVEFVRICKRAKDE